MESVKIDVRRPASRLQSLTGLRFLAALLVFGFHLSLNRHLLGEGSLPDAYRGLLKNAGWFGVTFFFVLSGFVLTWSVRPRDTYREFVARRLVKIYPNHLVTFVIAFTLFGLAGASALEAVGNLALLHAWVPRDTSFFSINHPSWSLSTELFFYLMFPALWFGLRRIPDRLLWPVAGLVMAVILVLPAVAGLLPAGEVFGEAHRNSPLYQHSMHQVWFLYAFPPVRLLDFALGMLMASIVRAGRWPGLPALPVAGLVLVAYLASLAQPLEYQLNASFVIPIALLIPAVATLDEGGRGGLLGHPRVVLLGEVSFAFYMVHDILLTGLGRLLGPHTPAPGIGLLLAFCALVVSIGAAWVLYRAVESPLTRAWARRRARVVPLGAERAPAML
ncbi:acyltransferase [Micromonospora sp. WMMD956]|uniref:acyltransferase family protein n=1 Tax=Micromonospora TaxID=1873 RepID=UPI002415FCDC|nr:acyltransferase [Micromonospora sp. WMMD956]MDG4814633.1 acyltransferase [Micromonospora sp. WMMD956]